MTIPTQSLTLTHAAARTHIFDRHACCLVARAHSRGGRQAQASKDTHTHRHAATCTRLQPHWLISLRELSTASREMAQEAELRRRNSNPETAGLD